ncbi:hypothetical protein AAG570_002412 [Ranatra chinensis]|uniref:Uncharacterized protein n=1 Tax=Ranatra chinensis TaxID=642074 RepID=A0ABD0Y7F3_9HEMI
MWVLEHSAVQCAPRRFGPTTLYAFTSERTPASKRLFAPRATGLLLTNTVYELMSLRIRLPGTNQAISDTSVPLAGRHSYISITSQGTNVNTPILNHFNIC